FVDSSFDYLLRLSVEGVGCPGLSLYIGYGELSQCRFYDLDHAPIDGYLSRGRQIMEGGPLVPDGRFDHDDFASRNLSLQHPARAAGHRLPDTERDKLVIKARRGGSPEPRIQEGHPL